MILHPAVLALVGGSLLLGSMLVYATWWGWRILRGWDLASGSRLQLDLERRTYLVSTLLAYVLAFELLSLFLYVYTADGLAPLFTGAMCAAGTLQANAWGYRVLLLKLVNAILAGLWLVVNHADQQGYDYPLVRTKYRLLLGIAPPVLLEVVLQAAYFRGLRPEIITSCCGSLFGSRGEGLAAGLAGLPGRPMAVALALALAGSIGAALAVRRTGRGALALGASAALLLPIGLAAVIAFVSPYVYELPAHHCPFCLLQREYRYVGYPMYGALLVGSVLGMGAGGLAPFRSVPSLRQAVPALQRRLAGGAAALLGLFGALVGWSVLSSNLRM